MAALPESAYTCTFHLCRYTFSVFNSSGRRYCGSVQHSSRIHPYTDGMAASTEVQSGLLSHILPFLHPKDAAEPAKSQSFPTCPAVILAAPAVELCPPHWRRRSPSLRTKLKAVLLKQWPESAQRNTLLPVSFTPRPHRSTMRVKDSDDYITARAANPWTGLVSPSVATPSPCTPNSPADALNLSDIHVISPTPGMRNRPPLSRANEGRKVNSKTARTWHTRENGWVRSGRPAASPRETVVTAGAEVAKAIGPSTLKDDQFVVHMPSAREPQPYAYPGRTPEQIRALELDKGKARRTSNQGFGSRQASGASDAAQKVSAGDAYASGQYRRVDARHLAPPISISQANSHIHAAQRHRILGNMTGQGFGETRLFTPSTFAPFLSPQTRKLAPGYAGQEMQDAVTRDMRLDKTSVHHATVGAPVPRPGANISRTTPCDDGGPDSNTPLRPKIDLRDNDEVLHVLTDLKQLPKVRLVHPNLAGLPRPTDVNVTSYGPACEAGSYGNRDVDQPLDSFSAVPHRRLPQDIEILQTTSSTADEDPRRFPSITSRSDMAIGLLLGLVALLYEYGSRLGSQLPRVRWVEALSCPDSTPEQRVDALKRMLSCIGQVLALFTAATFMWQLVAVVLGVFDVIMIPIKVLLWLLAS